MINKSTIIKSLCITLLIFFAGCSGIRVSQDYKPSRSFDQVKTYAWKSDKQEKTGDVRIDSPLMDERIRTAVANALSAKGFIKSSENPDVVIAYHYSLRSKISSSSNGPAIGFGFGTISRNSAIGFSTGVGSDINQYDEGQLVIDMNEVKTNDLIWRGTSTSRVETQAKPERITRLINDMVKKNLDQFPPDKKSN